MEWVGLPESVEGIVVDPYKGMTFDQGPRPALSTCRLLSETNDFMLNA